MKRPSVKTSLIAVMSAVIVAVGILSVASLRSILSIENSVKDIGNYWVERLLTARDIKENFAGVRLALARHGMITDEAGFRSEGQRLAEARAALESSVTRYSEGVRTEKGHELVNQLTPLISSYFDSAVTYVQLLRDGKPAAGLEYFNTKLRPHADDVNGKVNELVTYVGENARGRVVEAETTARSSFVVTTAVAVIATLISLAGMYLAVSGVANPIQRITRAMRGLAGGDRDSPVPYSGRDDEIGDMAGAVEIFRQNALANARLEVEAEENRLATEQSRLAEQERISREAERLRTATAALGEGLRRLAGGDLTARIGIAFSTEYESLRADFNATVDQLGKAIGAVAVAVRNMDSGTAEISAGANDLSRRTEQQAASLEETAAALDQITVNVSSSSRMTDEARGVARAATDSAGHSSRVVAEAEAAMQRIEQSSRQISNIIGVIDEIAFQTNLLALNAGVEAARAGEAGKGFAVVAQEVRELAQRSAQAAREIKELIRNSTGEVESGVSLVRDTGTALETITDYIRQINGHMEAIATSAREQSTGLSEINVAVNQMDQTTQQNAAMVEQSTAAAAALAQEAAKLRDLVAGFRLEEAGHQSALRQVSPVAPRQPSAGVVTPLRGSVHRTEGNLAVKPGNWEEF